MDDGVNIVRQADLSPLHDEGIIIYSHPLLLKQLGRVQKVCVDATFSSSPKLFSQLWIIYGLVGDVAWVPLIYANMPNKQMDTYTRLYDILDRVMLYSTDEPICFKDNLEGEKLIDSNI